MIEGLFVTIISELPAQSEVQEERIDIAEIASAIVLEERARLPGRCQSCKRGALM